MPTKYKSPYTTSFKSAVKRGTPWFTVVENIAKRHKKTTNYVWNSLWKAGVVQRVKFNGQWIYWPFDAQKTNAKYAKETQYYMWQWFVNWSFSQGYVKPEQFKKYAGSQKQFMTYFRKFWNKQYTTTTKTKKRTTRNKKRTTTRAYKFPKTTKTRRYRKAA